MLFPVTALGFAAAVTAGVALLVRRTAAQRPAGFSVMYLMALLFGAYPGAVMAHFMIDAGLWRLRDPFPRAFLARHVPSLVPSELGIT